MPSNHLILCHFLLLPPLIFPSIRVISNESVLHIKWPNIGVAASASVLPMNFQDWFPLGLTGWICLQSKGLKSLLQHHSSKALILWCSAFIAVQLTSIHDYWKTIALTRQTFVGKAMSLLFNMLSRLVIAFLPRSKHLLFSWLQSPSAVILEPKKISLSLFPLLPHLFTNCLYKRIKHDPFVLKKGNYLLREINIKI